MPTKYYRVEITQPGLQLKETLRLTRQLGGTCVGQFSAGSPDFRETREYSFNSYDLREDFIKAIRAFPHTTIRRTRTAQTQSEPVERRLPTAPRRLYHVTPTRRVRDILKYGLRLGSPPALSSPDAPSPHRRHIYLADRSRRIYLTDSPEVFEECEDEAFSSGITVLEVTVPSQTTIYHGSIYEDIIPTYYVKRSIPPQFLRVLRHSP